MHSPFLIGIFPVSPEEYLGGNDELLSVELEILESLTHLDLRLAVDIAFCVVEGVDSVIPCSLNEVLNRSALDRSADGQPA